MLVFQSLLSLSILAGTLFIVVIIHYLISRRLFRGLFSTLMNHIHNNYRSSTLFHAFISLVIKRKCPKGLPKLDPVEHVSKNVWRILGMNPGSFTLQGTNTWLVGNGESKVLIDTGEGFSSEMYVKFLLETVFPLTKTKNISLILLTHGHADHLGGVTTLLKELKKLAQPTPKVFKRHVPNGKYRPADFVCEHIAEGQCFNASEDPVLESIEIKSIYSPGHTDDHVAFTLQEKEFSSLFSGDCVLGCGTAVFDDLYEYMLSLEELRKLMVPRQGREGREVTTVIYPGHGPVIREKSLEKIDEYISHRDLREKEIYSVLQEAFVEHEYNEQNRKHAEKVSEENKVTSPIFNFEYGYNKSLHPEYRTSWEVMSKVYGSLPIFVKFSAQQNCLHHLNKLLKEKKVCFLYPDFWKLNNKIKQ